MIHHFLTDIEIAHLVLLHVSDRADNIDWRNSLEGKAWIKANEGTKPWSDHEIKLL